jgi:hypothetical protein
MSFAGHWQPARHCAVGVTDLAAVLLSTVGSFFA